MAIITLKNIPNDIYKLVKQPAANRRCLSSEIIAYNERKVRSRPIDAKASVILARALRQKTKDYHSPKLHSTWPNAEADRDRAKLVAAFLVAGSALELK